MIPERLIDELLGRAKSKQPLEVVVNSPLLVAIVTVLGTAFAGALISGHIQDRSKRNELELQAQRDYLKSQVEADVKAYELASRYVAAADDLITLTGINVSVYKIPDSEKIRTWMTGVRNAYDAADSEWRQKNQSTGFLLGYYHQDRPSVAERANEAWRQLVAGVDAFADCAVTAVDHPGKAADNAGSFEGCSKKRSSVDDRLKDFRSVVDTERAFFWKDSSVRK